MAAVHFDAFYCSTVWYILRPLNHVWYTGTLHASCLRVMRGCSLCMQVASTKWLLMSYFDGRRTDVTSGFNWVKAWNLR